MEAILKFYDDKKKVILPDNFETFSTTLAEMLEIPQEFLNKLKLFYKDKEEDKIMIQTSSDYNQFLFQLKKKEVSIIEIELENEDNKLKKKISESFMKDSFNENIINNNCLEIKNEIDNNNDKNNINIKPVINNLGKDNIQKNKNDELNNEIKPQLVQPQSIISQINNINKNNKNENQVVNNQNNDNINNNIDINHEINPNLYNINENIQNSNNINNENNNNNQNYKIQFNIACISCNTKPVYTKIYKCPECKMYFCKKCEKIYGPKHIHALLKIRTNEQFNKNLEEDSKISKVFEGVKDQVIDGFKKVSNLFSKNNNNNYQKNEIQNKIPNTINNFYKNNYPYPPNHNHNNNIPNNHHNYPNYNQKQMNFLQNKHYNNDVKVQKMINLARQSYDLSNINDQELKIALIKADYNIEKAVIMLFNYSK